MYFKKYTTILYVYYVLWNQKVTGGPISMGVSYQGMSHPQTFSNYKTTINYNMTTINSYDFTVIICAICLVPKKNYVI